MARLRASWRTSLPVVQQPRNPQSESIARSPYNSPVEAISRGYFCAGSRKRRSSPLKSLLIIAAVLAGDPATTDPRLELLTRLFDSQADCERVKTESTGEGKGEIEGKKVLRIVGRCQELTPEEVQQLRDALYPPPYGCLRHPLSGDDPREGDDDDRDSSFWWGRSAPGWTH